MSEPPNEPPQGNLWVGQFRIAARRRLDSDERDALLARLLGERRQVHRAHVASQALTIATVLAIGTTFALRPGDSGGLEVAFAALGMMVLVLGPVGALLEVVFASWRSRLVFLAAGATALGGYLLDDSTGREPGFWGLLWVVCFCLAIVLGGGAMLFVRFRSRPKRLAALNAAATDVDNGEVLVFERAAGLCGGGEGASRRLEVLPLSKLLYRVDGDMSAELRSVPTVGLGTPPPDAQAPSRLLSESEVVELRAARARFRRTGIGAVVFATWGTAVVLRLVENLLKRSVGPSLSGLGWLLAVALGLYIAIRRIRFQRALAADLEARTVERTSPTGPNGPRLIETLAVSKLIWSVDGLPPSWRTPIS